MTSNNNKFPQDAYLFPAVGESSRLLVGCSKEDYSASRIARAVEDCDAHLLNLNVTAAGSDAPDGAAYASGDDRPFPVVVDLRVSHRNPAGVGRSLERYGYTVLDSSTDDLADDDTTRRRIDEFFRFLEI